ncbi:hypothetical protein [Nocardia macrotermitis]|uniref:Uncharacterized protein n=1 Tax=Nocardia macrotermitis TaxID=2585198 RepID=A0A7K0D9L5_9NOCA|nr:hypothetical protein [Nocardia macrotermitis]MQY22388.1 hypothetical protein [Nocardia macrotermitis]
MRITSPLTPLFGALVLSASLGAGLLTATPAQADTPTALAAVPVAAGDGTCGQDSPTVDDVVNSAASAVRTVIPANRIAEYDRQVDEFRHTIAAVRVHRDALPVDPTREKSGRLGQLDDPIVTYLVDGLDAVRTGHLDRTMSVSRLTVNDVIEVFILATRVVKIPAQVLSGLVPTAGFFLSFIVGGVFSGVKWLARRVQDRMRENCSAPGTYAKLELSGSDFPSERVAVPPAIAELANQVVRANDKCTPMSDLNTVTLLDRTRGYLAHADLPIDHAALDGTAAGLREFLRDNRIAKLALMRKTGELGPVIDYMDYGPLTFLANLGYDIHEGKALDTVPLADVSVENALDLTTLTLDISSLLLTGANVAVGWTGVSSAVLTPLGMAQSLAFAPARYGAPILRGVLQTMCAA